MGKGCPLDLIEIISPIKMKISPTKMKSARTKYRQATELSHQELVLPYLLQNLLCFVISVAFRIKLVL